MEKDIGRIETDEKLTDLEKRIAKIYSQASKEVLEKAEHYLSAFATQDKEMRSMLEQKQITDAEYKEWKRKKIMSNQRWLNLRDTLAKDMNNANKIARSVTQETMPEVYAINHNWSTYEAEKGALANTNYTLYDRSTVERLLQDDPDLMPLASKGVNSKKDTEWNKKVIDSVLLQGILQGESINHMAERFAQVGARNFETAVRYARTATTGAENAGRTDGYKRAQKMGIKIKKVWFATLDDRTRDSHRELDGETREVDEPFSNGCLHPGDPKADDPSEVWNCRCTLITKVNGADFNTGEIERASKLGNMTYDEWKNGHKDAEPEPEPEPEPTPEPEPAPEPEPEPEQKFVPAKSIKEAEQYARDNGIANDVKFGRMDLERANVVNSTLTRLKEKYPTNTLSELTYNARIKANANANFRSITVGPPHEDKYWDNREKYLADYQELIDKYSSEQYKGNREAAKYVTRLKKAVKEIEEDLKYERWSTSSIYGLEGTIIHEYGHVIADQYFGQINQSRANKNFNFSEARDQNEYVYGTYVKAKGNGDIYKISGYAATDSAEFFAEVFAMYDKNEDMPDYIREMVEVILNDGIL